jgi:tRNA pseudouridine32 synthase/23S rRNA pseudouridine746 synthase
MKFSTTPDQVLDMAHEDEAVLVVVKPAGLLSVPGRGEDKQDSLSIRLQAVFAEAQVVHRLDMATSGLLVFARGAAAQKSLSCAFRERRVEKRYQAVVAGRMSESGAIDLPILADWANRPLRIIDAAQGKPSLTRFRLLAYDAETDTSRVELEPVTGRTHQLRVHLAAIGHAIIGDGLYGGRAAPRLLLHSCLLGFEHPVDGRKMAFTSAAPF